MSQSLAWLARKEQSDNKKFRVKGQIPTDGKTLKIKFPTPRAQKVVKFPGFARRLYGNTTQMIANDPGGWDDLHRLDRTEITYIRTIEVVSVTQVVGDCLGSVSI